MGNDKSEKWPHLIGREEVCNFASHHPHNPDRDSGSKGEMGEFPLDPSLLGKTGTVRLDTMIIG